MPRLSSFVLRDDSERGDVDETLEDRLWPVLAVLAGFGGTMKDSPRFIMACLRGDRVV